MHMNDLIPRASIDGFTFYDLLADFFLSSEHIKIGRFICGAGAIPRTAWIRTVTAAIPTRLCSKMAHILLSAQWLRTQCGRAPENWRFECPPTLETECAPMRESNNKHRANTRSQSNSESVSVEICRTPRGTNNFGSPNMVMDRSPGGLALPRDCPRPAPYRFERCVGLVVYKPEIPNSTQRSGAVPWDSSA
jgi:hypothetical protein